MSNSYFKATRRIGLYHDVATVFPAVQIGEQLYDSRSGLSADADKAEPISQQEWETLCDECAMDLVERWVVKTSTGLFYTGRVGEGYLSADPREAFLYTKNEALLYAKSLSRPSTARWTFSVEALP
jgi:hypothetical protein